MHYLNGIAFVVGWFVLGGFIIGGVWSALCVIAFLLYDYAIKRAIGRFLNW